MYPIILVPYGLECERDINTIRGKVRKGWQQLGRYAIKGLCEFGENLNGSVYYFIVEPLVWERDGYTLERDISMTNWGC